MDGARIKAFIFIAGKNFPWHLQYHIFIYNLQCHIAPKQTFPVIHVIKDELRFVLVPAPHGGPIFKISNSKQFLLHNISTRVVPYIYKKIKSVELIISGECCFKHGALQAQGRITFQGVQVKKDGKDISKMFFVTHHLP